MVAAGAFFIIPYFFVDLTDSEKVELNAARARYFALNRLAANKKCEGFSIEQPESSLKESLRVLSNLYEEGVISKEEYLQKREKVINDFNL
jgi:hypothetical protein